MLLKCGRNLFLRARYLSISIFKAPKEYRAQKTKNALALMVKLGAGSIFLRYSEGWKRKALTYVWCRWLIGYSRFNQSPGCREGRAACVVYTETFSIDFGL